MTPAHSPRCVKISAKRWPHRREIALPLPRNRGHDERTRNRGGNGGKRHRSGNPQLSEVPLSRPNRQPRSLRAPRDAPRLAARRSRREGYERGLRRGRLRRLHHRPVAVAPGRRSELRAGQRLHPAARPGRRRRSADGRGSRRGRAPASGAAGDGRLSRLAMRLLHARHRHEPVRALSPARGGDLPSRMRRARRQSLPLHRLSADHRCGAGDLRRQARRPFRRRDRRARRGAGGAGRRPRSVRRRRRRLLRRAGERSLARRALRPHSRAPCWSAARPTSACGSPSSCAT